MGLAGEPPVASGHFLPTASCVTVNQSLFAAHNPTNDDARPDPCVVGRRETAVRRRSGPADAASLAVAANLGAQRDMPPETPGAQRDWCAGWNFLMLAACSMQDAALLTRGVANGAPGGGPHRPRSCSLLLIWAGLNMPTPTTTPTPTAARLSNATPALGQPACPAGRWLSTITA